MRKLALVAAAAFLMAGCRTMLESPMFLPMGRDPYGGRADVWNFRSAVLLKVKPVFDNQSDIESVTWGVVFYRPTSDQQYQYSVLGRSRRGVEDPGDGVYWITLPAGEYKGAAFFTFVDNKIAPTPIAAESFRHFTLADGELKVLGTVDAQVRMRPAELPSLLSSGRTQFTTTVKGTLTPEMPAELAKAALAHPLTMFQSRQGWEPALQALAAGRERP